MSQTRSRKRRRLSELDVPDISRTSTPLTDHARLTVKHEVDVEVALRCRVADAIRSRIAWATALETTLGTTEMHGELLCTILLIWADVLDSYHDQTSKWTHPPPSNMLRFVLSTCSIQTC